MARFRFYAATQLWSDSVQVGIGRTGMDGDRSRVTNVATLTLNPIKEGDYSEPTMSLTPAEARDLMDALWGAGVRPSNGTGNVGQLGATEKHLEDMRRLVFDMQREGGSVK